MPCGVGGGGTHRSWPGGRGGRPRAWQFQKRGRVGAWLAVLKRSKSREGVREGLAWRSEGGARASVAGGVGGRGTGPRDEQISQRVSYFCRF